MLPIKTFSGRLKIISIFSSKKGMNSLRWCTTVARHVFVCQKCFQQFDISNRFFVF